MQTDISVGGRGPGLRVTRAYDGLAAAHASSSGVWGFGWTGPYGAHLVVSGEEVKVYQDNGSAVVFYKSGSAFTQGGWDQGRLVAEGAGYVYTLPDQRKLEFNSEGHLVKETDRNGNSNILTYNASHQLEKVSDPIERYLTFKYNAEGLVESVTDAYSGDVVSYTYSSKNLASVTIEGKVRWKFEYETPHLLTKMTDGRGHSITTKYDTSHRVIEQTIGGHTRKWTYGTSPGTETTLTEPNGAETVVHFNSAGEPTKVTSAKGTTIETTTEYEYNSENYDLIKVIDPNRHETKYTYDAEGNRISEIDASGDEKKWKFDSKHDVIEETAPEGETTKITRNTHGEPEVVERLIGTEKQRTEYKYGTKGELTEEKDPLGHITKFTYDILGDKEKEVDPEGDERKWEYNIDSQVIVEKSPRGFATEIERDAQGRAKKITDPLGHFVEYKYDGNGNVESETDGNGHITKYEYNEENLPTKTTEPTGIEIKTGYDSEGKITSHTDGNNHTWEYIRNKLEQVVEEKSPLLKVTKKAYDKAGNLETLEDPAKHITTYTYDGTNRLKTIKYSTGKPSEVTIAYNKDSKVTQMTDETGITENTWDKVDRLTEYKNGAGKKVKYEYNLDNQPTKIAYPNGKAITRAYDKASRLESVTDWNSKITSFKYNADSQLTNTVFPAGTENEDVYGYNEADQMTEVAMKGPLGATLGKLVYERNGDGQVKKTTTTTLPGPAISESIYDENNRLIEAQSKAYKYDKANNPEEIEGTTGYTYNVADQLEKGAGNTYTYNEDGQRTETKPGSGEPIHYAYDQAGNLTSVERTSPLIKDTYTYDGNNLRQSQTINGTKTNLTWDTAEPIPIILTDETNSYVYGPENVPIEQINATEEPTYLHHDQQGSTRLLTNKEGKNVGVYAYGPYGRTLEHTGTATTPLQYDAQYTSADTGLVYLRARTYDPSTAQFLSVDQALPKTGEPYSYGQDNPENVIDLSGLCGGDLEQPYAKEPIFDQEPVEPAYDGEPISGEAQILEEETEVEDPVKRIKSILSKAGNIVGLGTMVGSQWLREQYEKQWQNLMSGLQKLPPLDGWGLVTACAMGVTGAIIVPEADPVLAPALATACAKETVSEGVQQSVKGAIQRRHE